MARQDDEARRPAAAEAARISYAVLMLARVHRAYAARLLRELGLHPGQEHLLMHLYDRDGQTQSELLESVGLDHSTISKALSRMEQAGLLRREKSERDRRVIVVWLTDEGRAMRAPIERMWQTLERTAVGALDADQAESFLVMAENVKRAIEELG
jgi:DNA-binding MarR family transcriptional regulator